MPLLKSYSREATDPTDKLIDVKRETKKSLARNRFPAHVAKEATLIQYTVDTRLDMALEEFHFELMTGVMPPHPLQTIIQKMKVWGKRHSLFRLSNKEISKRFLPQVCYHP